MGTRQGKITPQEGVNWESLISATESQIEECRQRIQALRKSLIFFKKQKEMDVPFPQVPRANPDLSGR